jgi:hypothetical protein
MSQSNVERVIGMLVTDEAIRHRFTRDPGATLRGLVESGVALNPCELEALVSIEPALLSRVANAIDPRLQKSDLKGGSK